MSFENGAPSRAQQDAEAAGRNTIRDAAGNDLGADPRQTMIDDSTGEAGDPAPQVIDRDGGEPEPAGRPKPIYMSPQDEARAKIAKRFNREPEGEVPFNGDLTDPENLYGKAGRKDLPQPEPEASEPEARDEPRREAAPEKKYTIKVRGKELHLTEAELLERASKVEAADQYLDEGRNLLEQARAVRKNNAEHDGVDPHRPEGRTNTQDDGLNVDLATEDGQRPDPLVQAIEEIQFGDPKEAANRLRTVLEKASDESADKRQLNRLLQKDALASKEAIETFVGQNPELKDPDTERWIQNKLFDLQREEILKLGTVDADKIPTNTNDLAKWHQFYRVHGAKVSSQAELLNAAKSKLDQWRGVPAKAPERPRKDSPRVEVTVDRDARRASIPNQPARSSAPRPDAVQPKPQGPNRSSVISNMRKARGQLVG